PVSTRPRHGFVDGIEEPVGHPPEGGDYHNPKPLVLGTHNQLDDALDTLSRLNGSPAELIDVDSSIRRSVHLLRTPSKQKDLRLNCVKGRLMRNNDTHQGMGHWAWRICGRIGTRNEYEVRSELEGGLRRGLTRCSGAGYTRAALYGKQARFFGRLGTREPCAFGAIAQLVERYNGIVEVRGPTPLGSTSHYRPARTTCGPLFCVRADWSAGTRFSVSNTCPTESGDAVLARIGVGFLAPRSRSGVRSRVPELRS